MPALLPSVSSASRAELALVRGIATQRRALDRSHSGQRACRVLAVVSLGNAGRGHTVIASSSDLVAGAPVLSPRRMQGEAEQAESNVEGAVG